MDWQAHAGWSHSTAWRGSRRGGQAIYQRLVRARWPRSCGHLPISVLEHDSLEQAIVGMRLTNGESLFAEQSLGRGRVLMQSVSLARRDSTFPATLGFPVLMHLWTHHLAASQAVTSNIEPTSDFADRLVCENGSHGENRNASVERTEWNKAGDSSFVGAGFSVRSSRPCGCSRCLRVENTQIRRHPSPASPFTATRTSPIFLLSRKTD